MRVYEELDLQPIEAIGKHYQTKSIAYWQHLDTIAGTLINSEYYAKRSRKKTWINKAREFVKKNLKNNNIFNKKKVKKKINEIFKLKKKFNPLDKMNTLRELLKLKSGKEIAQEEVEGKAAAITKQQLRT
ncbi:hypothetical protein NUSPORA_01422 [Nucleospora cyclopteri]